MNQKNMKSLSMRRGVTNCDLDLRLSSPFANYYYDLMSSDTTTSSPVGPGTNNSMEEGGGSSNAANTAGNGTQQQPLTMIFNGKVCVVSNVTELQARAILCHAATGGSSEMDADQRLLINSTTSTTPATTPSPCSLPPSPSLLLQSPTTTTAVNTTEISMKRSLQSFLQKRKNRIQSFSSHPYNKQ